MDTSSDAFHLATAFLHLRDAVTRSRLSRSHNAAVRGALGIAADDGIHFTANSQRRPPFGQRSGDHYVVLWRDAVLVHKLCSVARAGGQNPDRSWFLRIAAVAQQGQYASASPHLPICIELDWSNDAEEAFSALAPSLSDLVINLREDFESSAPLRARRIRFHAEAPGLRFVLPLDIACREVMVSNAKLAHPPDRTSIPHLPPATGDAAGPGVQSINAAANGGIQSALGVGSRMVRVGSWDLVCNLRHLPAVLRQLPDRSGPDEYLVFDFGAVSRVVNLDWAAVLHEMEQLAPPPLEIPDTHKTVACLPPAAPSPVAAALDRGYRQVLKPGKVLYAKRLSELTLVGILVTDQSVNMAVLRRCQ
eukprot:TRINITY_DN1851_c0_g1_i2.p1 TRINITY_DN1851_c0_g1~~TRINITY_DN1851_c0_g1_i2.p1  ORF type:complete len:363 (-),score=34.88 TRINITY_DN1851_c0_g1_i2:320-1408(-)